MSQTSGSESPVLRQYQDPSNLEARIALHKRFSVNEYGWQRWVFDQIDLRADARVLDVGCARGDLWRDNSDRIPCGWVITLSDFSDGMLEAARTGLSSEPARFGFEKADVRALPWEDASFDAVVANHVLFHVPDLDGGVSEIHRVLRPAGRLYATTIGSAHMRELTELLDRLQIAESPTGEKRETFSLENGAQVLGSRFRNVVLKRYDDGLEITEIGPLVKYVRSMMDHANLDGAVLDELLAVWERELTLHGVIRITKDSGMFEAVRADGPVTSGASGQSYGREAARFFEPLDEDPDRSGGAELPGPLTIRRATPADAESLGRLSAEREGGNALAHGDAVRRALESDEVGRTSLVLVAEVASGIIGFGKVKHLSSARSAGGSVTPEGWYLTGVVVDPRFRRRGVGARLTEDRLQWISERSRFAYYFSNARNPVSIALHERFGFIEVSCGAEFAGESFVGGEGILFRADLTGVARGAP